MSLLEGMIAAVVLFIIGAGILDVLFTANKLTLITRHSDNARAYLVAFSDQFARGNCVDVTNPTQLLAGSIWQPTGVTSNSYGTGVGLTWNGTAGTVDGLPVTLGDSESSSIPATIFRKVSYIQTAYPYSTTNGVSSGSATDMVSATFTIVFTIHGEQKIETMTIARLWKNANGPTT